jgi:hypothetical protein
MRVVAAGVVYFLVVFGAGFVLGPIRVLWLVPRVGVRMAELLEMPIMLLMIVLAARWIARRFAVPSATATRFGMGLVALALLLTAEFMLVRWLQGMTVREYLAARDPVSGAVYLAMLSVFAAMPWLVSLFEHGKGSMHHNA